MALNEKQEAFRKRVLAYTEEWLHYDTLRGNGGTKVSLDRLLKINHYDHILRLMGAEGIKDSVVYIAYTLAKRSALRRKNEAAQRAALVKLNLIDGHAAAWNIAHFHYERAIKNLCMMMATLMDYIIREQTGKSALYGEPDESEYFDVAEEIAALNDEYRNEYISVCAFDFCTKKIGVFMDIPEYAYVAREHNRIINNGNPQRVQDIIDRMQELCADLQPDILQQIRNAYTPEPLYSEELFEQCYADAVSHYETEENAMEEFNTLVSKVSADYLVRLDKS